MQQKYDLVLFEGETREQVRDMLEKRFGVVAAISESTFNSAHCLVVDGTAAQLRSVKQWYNASHADRPDLAGKAPVAKGEKRT